VVRRMADNKTIEQLQSLSARLTVLNAPLCTSSVHARRDADNPSPWKLISRTSAVWRHWSAGQLLQLSVISPPFVINNWPR